MEISYRHVQLGTRAIVVAACLLGIWESWKIIKSDELYWTGNAEAIRSAIREEPDCWWCYMQLARLDDEHAEELLRTSLQLNPYNSDAAIDLGLRYEAEGNFDGAEKSLLQAFAVDQTYAPRWTLANFYFRRGNLPAFWTWARRAAEMPVDDIGALFGLCWRANPDPSTIEANIINHDPSVIRQYVDFLMSKDQPQAAVHVAVRLISTGSQEVDRARLLQLTDRLIAANDAASADKLWHELIRQHWIVADSSFPNNPEFARDPLPVRFDWHLSADNGLHSWPGPSGLMTEFTGDEPENSLITEETISLQPGGYVLEASYRTRDIAADTGIQWEVAEMESDTAIASSPFLSSNKQAIFTLPFLVKPNHGLLRLRLVYRRQTGTPRVSGMLAVKSIRIETLPST
jgi:tetratricopeptide (TPR) repeat protein